MKNKIQENISGKPFLRWAGGKNWLVKSIAEYLPSDGFNNYIEPFLGGGSIFFHLSPDYAELSDLNPELIQTYAVVKNDVQAVISELEDFKNTEDFYYMVRSQKPTSEVKQAARFIYLNQTSFNGIYRVNLKGEYNVPYGHRKNNFLRKENLIQASKILQKAQLHVRDFKDSIKNIAQDDLVFLDPPYTVNHNNGFIQYNAKLFDIKAQHELADLIDEIQERGAKYILTNAAHDEIRKIFYKPNFNQIIETSRASLIGGKQAERGRYSEFIITNIFRNGRQLKR